MSAILSVRNSLRLTQIQVRYKLMVSGLFIVVVSLGMIFLVLNAYDTVYQLLNGIAQNYSVKVDASISALESLANINKYAADLIAYTDDINQQEAMTQIYGEFQSFRDDMFTIRKGLVTPEEIEAYNEAETTIYNEYWGQAIKIIAARLSADQAAAVEEFNLADKLFEEKISLSMSHLEQANYATMLQAQVNANNVFSSQTLQIGIVGFGLASFMLGVSFWLRRKVRRYFTPGIDLATILVFTVTLAIVFQMTQFPEQLRIMVQDAYYSITASARVMADASRANITESAALNDPQNSPFWQQKFDHYVYLITLRICGQPNCLTHTFSQDGKDIADSAVAKTAKGISPESADLIDHIVPLMGNITFKGEVTTLEQARLAYLDYLNIDRQTRNFLANNNLEAAIRLNTGRDPGQSDEAFFRFIDLMTQEKMINRNVFQEVWTTQQETLNMWKFCYTPIGFLMVSILCIFGVYHRFQEL